MSSLIASIIGHNMAELFSLIRVSSGSNLDIRGQRKPTQYTQGPTKGNSSPQSMNLTLTLIIGRYYIKARRGVLLGAPSATLLVR